MPNLVGIGLSQVPTNSMLGGLAYQDPEHASIKDLDLKNLSQINSEIADTAVDIFIYDTSKDSDGGAWRKRTQHTSWYNETLGTATRGTRREFPAVAVFVAESNPNKITIYDGDDPDLPMWMVFRASTNTNANFLTVAGQTLSSIFIINGDLCIGFPSGNGWGISRVNFVSDSQKWYWSSAPNYKQVKNTIAERNAQNGYVNSNSGISGLVSASITDLAMTVLPKAPIDSATGLPIPTVAAAALGGISILKDDGTVVDAESTGGGNYNQSKAITITEENYLWWLGDYFNGSTYLRDSFAISLDNFPSSDFTWNNSTDNLSNGSYYALTTGNEAGEIKIGSVNTWAWNKQERNALGGPAGLAIHKPNIGSETNSLIAAITSDYNTGWMHGASKAAFLCDTDTTNKTNGQTDPDRSVENNTVTVAGTVTKSAVATGADLVAYSGFTASNYMTYNASDMAFGTGDFSVSVWCIPSTDTTNEFILELDNASQGSNRFYLLTTATATKKLYTPWSNNIAGSELTPEAWNHVVVGRTSGVGYVYVNGNNIPAGTIAWTTALNGNGNGTISNYSNGIASNYAWSGSLALLRISGGTLTAEQIRKMYDDEKDLFQENSKCTLYGSSNAVTALAYDEGTDQYHVGTSAGRSDFQGLRRINNTTTAVTTAISAHDGFIIEQ